MKWRRRWCRLVATCYGAKYRLLDRRNDDTRRVVFTHHKTGTVLVLKVLRDLRRYFGVDVQHELWSRVSAKELESVDVGVHFIRDPREVIVSAYRYHLRSDELWLHESVDAKHWERAPYRDVEEFDRWKERLRKRVGKRTYQEYLRGLTESEGIQFEMEGVAGATIQTMLDWPSGAHVQEAKLEDVMENFDGFWAAVLKSWGFEGARLKWALRLVGFHDLMRVHRAGVALPAHVTNSRVGERQWPAVATPEVEAKYAELFGKAHQELGYGDDGSR